MKPRIAVLALAMVIGLHSARPIVRAADTPAENQDMSDQALLTRWKTERVTMPQIESETSFGRQVPADSDKWKAFKAQFREGDEVWLCVSPRAPRIGWQGYAIFRDGRLIAKYTLIQF
jgi:hypothetical protein